MVLAVKFREVFEEALRELRHRGWYQGDFASATGQVCAVGAINAAMSGDPDDVPVVDAYIPILTTLAHAVNEEDTDDLLQLLTGSDRETVVDGLTSLVGAWNDDGRRKEKDVIGLFQRVIAS